MTSEHSARLRADAERASRQRTSWTADVLVNYEFPEPKWAVPGLIPEGVTVLAGAPKAGKSWLALNVAVAVASGGKALGRIPVNPGAVLYLALEDHGRRLQERLRTILAGEPGPRDLQLELRWPRLDDGGGEMLDERLSLRPDWRLVIVDVFTKVRRQVRKGDGIYDADYRAVNDLKALADRHEVPIVMVHHIRKEGSEDFLAAVTGSFGITGAADAVLGLVRARGSSDAILKVTGRDVEEQEHALRFAPDIGSWNLTDEPIARLECSTDERQRILDAVRNTPGLGPKGIADATGIGHGTVKHLVRKMLDAGVIDTDNAGHYFEVNGEPHSPRSPIHRSGEQGEHGERGEHGEHGEHPTQGRPRTIPDIEPPRLIETETT